MKMNLVYRYIANTVPIASLEAKGLLQGPICRGAGLGGPFNPPNDFFDPRVSVDLSSWGVDSNPIVTS